MRAMFIKAQSLWGRGLVVLAYHGGLGLAAWGVLAAVLSASGAQAQAPAELVKDINLWAGLSSSPEWITQVGSITLFVAGAPTTGKELWRTDGSAAGTMLVKDIAPGAADSAPSSLTAVNDAVFFLATDGTGYKLWKSDGTATGTVVVRDLAPENLIAVGGSLFFTVREDTDSFQLWKSDGTAAGTILVKTISVGGNTARPHDFVHVNGTLFFVFVGQLWKSDGTAEGTVLVKDAAAGWSSPVRLTSVGHTLFFFADDRVHGGELWKSDGTAEGTVLVKDIHPGTGWSSPSQFTDVGGTLFFVADDGVHGSELWKSDGCDAGTVLVSDIAPGSSSSYPYGLINAGGTLFFVAMDGVNPQWWTSDGTAGGTTPIGGSPAAPLEFTAVDNTLFFVGYDSVHGAELWKSDGTPEGTVLVKDINPGSFSAFYFSLVTSTQHFTNANGTLIFAADDGVHGTELWKSNGTSNGTVLVRDIETGTAGSSSRDFVEINGVVYFVASLGVNNIQLWKTDGSAAGTVLVKELGGSGVAAPVGLTEFNGMLYFMANGGSGGLWKSDGTAEGTVLVKSLTYGYGLVNVDGTLFFSGEDGSAGRELWKSDGTAAGTVLVKDINADLSSYPQRLIAIDGKLFFTANDGVNGYTPWISDGTAAGTVPLWNFDAGPGPTNKSNSPFFTEVNGTVFFNAADAVHGAELWKTDGTPEGTSLVADINPGANWSGPVYFTSVSDSLFFVADDGVLGDELWKSDGTAAGTVLVKDIYPGSGSSSARYLFEVNGRLFFVANDGAHGWELWTSDGTEAGTVLVRDIRSGSGRSFDPNSWSSFANVNGRLWFAADDDVHGRELWVSDGSAAGTVLLADIQPGVNSSFPGFITQLNQDVLLVASAANSGSELWRISAIALCGNAVLDPGEECDDGNVVNGDGCSVACRFERCGDGYLEGAEVCDDGNTVAEDLCKNDCTPNVCGDGTIQTMIEACDDGNSVSGDGCSTDCVIEAGYACFGQPSSCSPTVVATSCAGDCNQNNQVTVDEVLVLVNIALGNMGSSACLAGDGNKDSQVTVDEILAAVHRALDGCA